MVTESNRNNQSMNSTVNFYTLKIICKIQLISGTEFYSRADDLLQNILLDDG